MSARIEAQVECGSCDRIEWCGLFEEEDYTGRNDELVIDEPKGWYVGPASREGTPVVYCPDHNTIRAVGERLNQ